MPVSNGDALDALQRLEASGLRLLGVAVYHGFLKTYESELATRCRKALAQDGLPDLALVVNAQKEYLLLQ